jgi:hypothetical protein
MGPSKQFQEILKLGNKLVAELNAAGIDDVLSTWMAHHLAGLINQAENTPKESKADIENQCIDLILKLWNNRATLPRRARPVGDLEPAAKLLNQIAQQSDGHWARYIHGEDHPLGKFGAAVDEGHKRVMGLLMFLQSINIDMVDVKKWVSDHGTLLTGIEKKFINDFDKVVEHTAYYYGFKDIRSDPEAASEAVLKAIAEQITRFQRAFDELNSTIKKKTANQDNEEDLDTETDE